MALGAPRTSNPLASREERGGGSIPLALSSRLSDIKLHCVIGRRYTAMYYLFPLAL